MPLPLPKTHDIYHEYAVRDHQCRCRVRIFDDHEGAPVILYSPILDKSSRARSEIVAAEIGMYYLPRCLKRKDEIPFVFIEHSCHVPPKIAGPLDYLAADFTALWWDSYTPKARVFGTNLHYTFGFPKTDEEVSREEVIRLIGEKETDTIVPVGEICLDWLYAKHPRNCSYLYRRGEDYSNRQKKRLWNE